MTLKYCVLFCFTIFSVARGDLLIATEKDLLMNLHTICSSLYYTYENGTKVEDMTCLSSKLIHSIEEFCNAIDSSSRPQPLNKTEYCKSNDGLPVLTTNSSEAKPHSAKLVQGNSSSLNDTKILKVHNNTGNNSSVSKPDPPIGDKGAINNSTQAPDIKSNETYIGPERNENRTTNNVTIDETWIPFLFHYLFSSDDKMGEGHKLNSSTTGPNMTTNNDSGTNNNTITGKMLPTNTTTKETNSTSNVVGQNDKLNTAEKGISGWTQACIILASFAVAALVVTAAIKIYNYNKGKTYDIPPNQNQL